MFNRVLFFLFVISVLHMISCESSNNEEISGDQVVLLLLDEEAVDNDGPPNDFTAQEVNDQIAEIGLRTVLKFFDENPGLEIDLHSGQVGDEGWFALKSIPASWISAGPDNNGSSNFLQPGPGLGIPDSDGDREKLLDDIEDVVPLRASALSMLIGKTVLAVVYDNDIAMNYSPLIANLKGANLGIVAFDVLDVTPRNDASDSSLPAVRIKIRSMNDVSQSPLMLFSNPPLPDSSSEPVDVIPGSNLQIINLIPAG